MTAQLHVQAVLDRLGSHGSPVLTVFDGRVPDADPPTVPPYVLVRCTVRAMGARDRPDASDLIMRSLAVEVTARIHSVGESARAVRALTNRVSAALLDWTPTVATRSCAPMRHLDSADMPPDEATGIAYHEVADVYRFVSHPA